MSEERQVTPGVEEIRRLNAICFWLILRCLETNATSMKITQEKVHHKGKQLGDWEITVQKK